MKSQWSGIYKAHLSLNLDTKWEKLALSDFRLIYLKMGPIGCPETSVRNYHCVIS